jgi:hypothetical protein
MVVHEHVQKNWQESGQVHFYTRDNPNMNNTTQLLKKQEHKRTCRTYL